MSNFSVPCPRPIQAAFAADDEQTAATARQIFAQIDKT
jgi:hypothetical protein